MVAADALGWTPDQLTRREQVLGGLAVVANLTMVQGSGRRVDAALIAWAEETDRLVYIGRRTPDGRWPGSPWNNPFNAPEHGDRAKVAERFRNYLRYNIGLQERLPRLRGRVLACWCHPQTCHGHVIAEAVNAMDGR
jgi:hypothetical protein